SSGSPRATASRAGTVGPPASARGWFPRRARVESKAQGRFVPPQATAIHGRSTERHPEAKDTAMHPGSSITPRAGVRFGIVLALFAAGAARGADPDPQPKHSANRLARETSPYLLLHAHNPVDWYPWGPEAFARAKAEKKPIFLSIGYSACYWCHVM